MNEKLIYKNPKTFVMGGDMGDIIYHLLFIRKLGGNTFHIDPSGGVNGGRGYIRNGFIANGNGNPGKFNLTKTLFLMPLLKRQTYIKNIDLYTGDPKLSWKFYDVNASEYHKDDIHIRNLTYFHAKKYDLKLSDLNEPWLEIDEKKIIHPDRDIVINRSLRYRGNDNFYHFNAQKINEKAIFVGLKEEYENFTMQFGCVNVPHIETFNALELARVIAGCKKFVGNGSLAASIAIGLGIDVKYEFCGSASNYLFKRENLELF